MSKVFKKYIERHNAAHYLQNCSDGIEPQLIVVIPVYLERDYLSATLNSLFNCRLPQLVVEIILVFNSCETDNREVVIQQEQHISDIQKSIIPLKPDSIDVSIIRAYNLPKKIAGPGTARKIGMDSAAARFYYLGNFNGVIVSLDADSTVSRDYFINIYSRFSETDVRGASIYFEHDTDGDQFDSDVYLSALKYELHLRYVRASLSFARFPFAYHTVGSAIALTALSYVSIGGMPRKQAGEDFYFLQKLIYYGGFGEINDVVVRPSSRPSNRVIFGTGAAISSSLSGDVDLSLTYSPSAFLELKEFLTVKDELYYVDSEYILDWCKNSPLLIREFLLFDSLLNNIKELKTQCSSLSVFQKRFYELFNYFKVVKYLNFVHNTIISKESLYSSSKKLLIDNNLLPANFGGDEKELLNLYRRLDKGGVFHPRLFF
ncbi:glycosyltransferase [Marinilabiliaceae bacterium ANBcel2]|nr:glycosyltransferase [Marinilabiliaceae bacterium ANBcel2]